MIDNCFSSLDNKSAHHIFKKVFLGYLESKTKIISLNKIELLPYFDKIIFLDEGKIEIQGKFNDIKENKKFA